MEEKIKKETQIHQEEHKEEQQDCRHEAEADQRATTATQPDTIVPSDPPPTINDPLLITESQPPTPTKSAPSPPPPTPHPAPKHAIIERAKKRVRRHKKEERRPATPALPNVVLWIFFITSTLSPSPAHHAGWLIPPSVPSTQDSSIKILLFFTCPHFSFSTFACL